MADNSLTADDIRRHIPFLKNRIAENLNTLQSLLFLSCETFEFLQDIEAVSEDMPLVRQWRELTARLQEN